MKFIDEVKIIVSSGRGGDGSLSFRREKFVPRGGPDGGDGGDGGNIYFKGSSNLNTLMTFRGKKLYKAEVGTNGAGRRMHGRNGNDIIIEVPLGTIIRDFETSEIIADITSEDTPILFLSGGRGGLGNVNFKTSTNQAPRKATEGKEGEEREITLELKLLADIALIGLPNAGKSTLISVISSAKPKIADYDFTTLEPNLGVVELGDNSFTVADIPGLIEDASEGKGLGHKFLKHIERTSAFVHLIDCSLCLNEYEAFESYTIVRGELEKFNEELMWKKEIVCLTKTDSLSDDEIDLFIKFFEKTLDKKVLSISSVAGTNIEALKSLMLQVYISNKEKNITESTNDSLE